MAKAAEKTATKTAEVRARVEPQLKEDATRTLGQLGLTMSQGVQLFLREVVNQNGLPFDLKVKK